jgi:hypothetical protein
VGVGARAVVGVVAVAVLVGVGAGLLLRGGGDGDDEGGSAEPASDTSTEPDDEDEDAGTGTFEGELTEGEPVAVFRVRLDAGEALRAVVEGLDSVIGLGADDDARTEGFESLQPRVYDDDDSVDAERVFLGTDRSSDDVEGVQFVAPSSGTWTILVTSIATSEGTFDLTVETDPGDDDGLDTDTIEYHDYLAHYGEHVDFFCDEDFFGGDPEDVTNYGPTVCDAETLNGVLAGQLSGDFTNDFGVED